jgi:Flp pilus assembly protein TadG
MHNATLEDSGLARMIGLLRMAALPVKRAMIRMLRCSNGAIGPMAALMMIPVAGSIAYAVELGGWNYMQRSAQNAADSAALAAASVNSGAATTGSTSQNEARATAKKFGFTDGVSNTTVTAATVTCPTGVVTGSVCYQASINTTFPTLFSGVIGNTGGQLISTIAIATASGGGGSQKVCAGSLGPGVSFRSNGGPLPNMAGCTIASRGSMTCTGHNLGATYGVAVGTDSGCGVTTVSSGSPFTDPYDAFKSNIPSGALASCGGSFPQMAKVTGQWTAAAANRIIGTPVWSGTQKIMCGDVQLSGNVTLTGTTTLIIENGRLDLNGFKIATASGAEATIVFSGDNTAAYSHYPSSLNNGGTIDISAPSPTSSSPWKEIAIYQDPAITNKVSFTYSGNDPTWDISGAVYLPKADVTFSGIVNKSSTGSSCFTLIAYTILVNGTAAIFANNNACTSGPTVTVGTGTREKLVR